MQNIKSTPHINTLLLGISIGNAFKFGGYKQCKQAIEMYNTAISQPPAGSIQIK
jgi:hypothetical protein